MKTLKLTLKTDDLKIEDGQTGKSIMTNVIETIITNWLGQNQKDNTLQNQRLYWKIMDKLEAASEESVDMEDAEWGFLKKCREQVTGLQAGKLIVRRCHELMDEVKDR